MCLCIIGWRGRPNPIPVVRLERCEVCSIDYGGCLPEGDAHETYDAAYHVHGLPEWFSAESGWTLAEALSWQAANPQSIPETIPPVSPP